MVLGPSAYLVNKWLDATFNNVSFVVAQAYLKLHLADPGATGINAPATYTTRPLVSFGNASGGVVLNDVQVQITSITGSEDASHYSLWDASTAGNYLGSGIINANAYTAGDTLTFAVGAISIALTVAS